LRGKEETFKLANKLLSREIFSKRDAEAIPLTITVNSGGIALVFFIKTGLGGHLWVITN
jgi:hypothetical protein